MASEFHLICIGKLKDPGLEQVEQDYLKRLHTLPLHIHELKAKAQRPDVEANEVVKCLERISPKTQPLVVLLDERGKSLSSTEFAALVKDWSRGQREKVIFCLGGAQGHGPLIRARASELLSLSSMTLPHRLARLLFVEQFYRAYTLNTGHPYHNA